MAIILIGFILDMLGKVLLALSVFLVHNRVMKERRIDKRVIKGMRKERNLVIIGLILIVVGFLLQAPSKI